MRNYVVGPDHIRHVVRRWADPVPKAFTLKARQTPTLCCIGIYPEDTLPETAANHDCKFCLAAAGANHPDRKEKSNDQETTANH
jgi:hypothetical protein